MATQTPEQIAAQAAHVELIEQRDIHSIHKTFRNPSWKPNQRRNKNVKTILGDASRREASALATPQENNSGANTPRASRNAAAAAAAAAGKADDDGDGLSTSGASTPAGPATGSNGGAGLPPNLAQANRSLSKLVLEKSLRLPGAAGTGHSAGAAALSAVGASAPSVTYTNIESAPSLAPQRRYCDITGLSAPYTDPKTRLRYHNMEVFAAIRNFQQGVAEQYLETRGAHTVLK
ncbi:INO80 complex subunit C [Sporothrix brasiliensis 5110]|uniref:INO80 complex subunit C n=1 Tax=Sporothrix brasiliensis 5110 TaxID=1398154 RepID=A0A0C2IH60_9PEZI|nr:INO80 complex subunit C [Sporothrix brasiliensis 5110]KIH88546.1 INO80 complex subunit C [Sporothrix brasiliensis 5110]